MKFVTLESTVAPKDEATMPTLREEVITAGSGPEKFDEPPTCVVVPLFGSFGITCLKTFPSSLRTRVGMGETGKKKGGDWPRPSIERARRRDCR